MPRCHHCDDDGVRCPRVTEGRGAELCSRHTPECPVCLDAAVKRRVFEGCGHHLCLTCLARVNDLKCPVCRASIAPSLSVKERDAIARNAEKKRRDEVREGLEEGFPGRGASVEISFVVPSLLSLAHLIDHGGQGDLDDDDEEGDLFPHPPRPLGHARVPFHSYTPPHQQSPVPELLDIFIRSIFSRPTL